VIFFQLRASRDLIYLSSSLLRDVTLNGNVTETDPMGMCQMHVTRAAWRVQAAEFNIVKVITFQNKWAIGRHEFDQNIHLKKQKQTQIC
jgi:hypothetical protein